VKLKAVYSASLNISGGTPPYLSRLTSGSLPPGLTLSSALGTISGVPIKKGTYRFAVTTTDFKNASTSKNLSIQVN
jgi:hypothetical protein